MRVSIFCASPADRCERRSVHLDRLVADRRDRGVSVTRTCAGDVATRSWPSLTTAETRYGPGRAEGQVARRRPTARSRGPPQSCGCGSGPVPRSARISRRRGRARSRPCHGTRRGRPRGRRSGGCRDRTARTRSGCGPAAGPRRWEPARVPAAWSRSGRGGCARTAWESPPPADDRRVRRAGVRRVIAVGATRAARGEAGGEGSDGRHEREVHERGSAAAR